MIEATLALPFSLMRPGFQPAVPEPEAQVAGVLARLGIDAERADRASAN